MTRWRTRHRGSHVERGAAAVEFAIVLVVLLLIIFAIIDFGRLLYASQAVKSASREGARAAVVQPGTGAAVLDAVEDAAGSAVALAANGQPTVNWQLNWNPTSTTPPNTAVPDSTDTTSRLCTGNAPVTVFVQVPFRWFTPAGLFTSDLTSVSSTTTMRCE